MTQINAACCDLLRPRTSVCTLSQHDVKQTNNTSDILKKYEEKEKNDSDAEDENKGEFIYVLSIQNTNKILLKLS